MDSNVRVWRRLAAQVATLGRLFDQYVYGIISEEEFRRTLREKGYSEESIESMFRYAKIFRAIRTLADP